MSFVLEPFYPHTPAFLEVVSVYQCVWGGDFKPMSSSIEFFLRQTTFPGWRGVLARDETGVVQGFAFGSVVEAGQWWHDRLLGLVNLSETWCLVELAVLEAARRQGMAQALHDALVAGVQQPRLALSTQVNNTAALAFYAKNGYRTLVGSVIFTPGLVSYTILGKELARVSAHGQRTRAGGFIIRHAPNPEVLLMQRHKPSRGIYFVIPGGSTEPNENLEQSAARELLEETSLEFSLKQQLYQSYNPSSQRTAYYYLAEYRSGEATLSLNAPERLEKQTTTNLYIPTWVKLEELSRLPLFPSIIRQRLEYDLRHPPLQPVYLEEYD
jgi:ADP-ribose pyrophosphatase YjhB (NUDIX family)/GNAT superfamily N-acetyltransferase